MTAMWESGDVVCLLILRIATVVLDSLASTKELEEIDCPGDTLSYNCSIQSNTETLHLTWTVEIPDLPPIGITYDNTTSVGSESLLDMNITTSLVALREGYIQSDITLVILDAYMNGTVLRCSIADLNSDMEKISVNTSG